MELIFEEVLTFDNKDRLQFGHEPDDLFIGYYIKDTRLENQSSDPYMGDFSSLEWQTREARRITASPVSSFGIKTFPQFGAYGFYTPLYGDGTSRVVAPINPKRGLRPEPSLELSQDETTVTVKITDSRNVSYKCYRVMFRDGHFAHEFITYDKELVVEKEDLPPGTYIVTLIGFIPDKGIASHETRTLATPLSTPYGVPAKPMLVVSWSNDGKYLAVGYEQEFEGVAGFTWYKRVDDTLSKLNIPSDFPKLSIKQIKWSGDSKLLMINDDSSNEQYRYNVNTSDTLSKAASSTGLVDYSANVSWSPNEEYLAVGFPTLLWYKSNPNVEFVVTGEAPVAYAEIDASAVSFNDSRYVADRVDSALVEVMQEAAKPTVTHEVVLRRIEWQEQTLTVFVPDVTADSVLLVAPIPADQVVYTTAGIICVTQGDGSITLTCTSVPTRDVTIGVVLL